MDKKRRAHTLVIGAHAGSYWAQIVRCLESPPNEVVIMKGGSVGPSSTMLYKYEMNFEPTKLIEDDIKSPKEYGKSLQRNKNHGKRNTFR